MSDLLKLAVNGHGGMHRWERISRFRAADDQRADVRSQERADDLLPPAEPDPLAIYQNALRRHQFLGGGSHSCISTRKYPPGTASAPAGSATGSPGSPYRSSNYGRNHLNPASRAIPRIGGSGGARCGGMRKSTRGLGDDGVPAARGDGLDALPHISRIVTYMRRNVRLARIATLTGLAAALGAVVLAPPVASAAVTGKPVVVYSSNEGWKSAPRFPAATVKPTAIYTGESSSYVVYKLK
jgi:hypothetical protein